MKVCVVSSCGGHLTEVRMLRPAYERYEHFYVLNDRIELPPDMVDKTYFIRHAERDWRVLANLWEAFAILRKERPTAVLSTGAGPAVPFAVVARAMGIAVVFVETFARIKAPSLTGRLMYPLATRFFYQWPELARFFPRATHGGPLV